jgi:hypothetical protein
VLRQDQCTDGAHFLAYLDQEPADNTTWECRTVTDLFRSPRRNARMHKILAHQFVFSEISIWMDSNVALKVPAQQLVDEYLQSADLAVFRHRTRNCTYDEAQRCRLLQLDTDEIIAHQVHHYKSTGLPGGLGLPETTVVIRRNSEQVRRFNNAWWSEICRHSVRDQISFMYAAKEAGLAVNFIVPTKYRNPYFSMTNRPPGQESNAEV